MQRFKQLARCLEAIAILSAVDLLISALGLSRVLDTLNDMFKGNLTHEKDEENRLAEIVAAFRTASLIYPGHIECLQRSLTVFILARRRRLNVKMYIGVQKSPFISHAWIIHRHCLFIEDEELINNLAVVWESL